MTKIGYTLGSWLLILFMGLMLSCQEFTFQPSDPNQVVIKAFLYADHVPTINLTKQILYGATDTTLTPVDDVSPVIYDSHNNAYPLSYTKNGNYTSSELIVMANETYTLKFTFNNKEVSATTTVPSKPANFYGTSSIQVTPIGSGYGMPSMERATYSWDNPDSKYFLLAIKCTETTLTPINDTSKYEAFPIFRQSPTQGKTESLMGRSFYYYGMHDIILYAINSEYVDLYEDVGNTSQNITTPPGNITNGYGIFTGINADTLKLRVYY